MTTQPNLCSICGGDHSKPALDVDEVMAKAKACREAEMEAEREQPNLSAAEAYERGRKETADAIFNEIIENWRKYLISTRLVSGGSIKHFDHEEFSRWIDKTYLTPVEVGNDD